MDVTTCHTLGAMEKNELVVVKRMCFEKLMDEESKKSLFCTSLVHNLLLCKIDELVPLKVSYGLPKAIPRRVSPNVRSA